MSSEAKKVYSRVKNTISNEWSFLYIDTIEVLEYLKSWFQAEIFIQENYSKTLHQ